MKKGDVFGLSWTTLFGIIFAVIFILFAWNSSSFAKILFGFEDDNKVEESMTYLQERIYQVAEGDSVEIPFYSSGVDVYLMAFNKDYRNPTDCYDSACIVLCSDEKCESAYYVRKLPESIIFENPGKIAYLGEVEKGYLNLVVENIGDKIWVYLANVDCSNVRTCYDYGSDNAACSNDPCNVDRGYGCQKTGSGACTDVMDIEPMIVG